MIKTGDKLSFYVINANGKKEKLNLGKEMGKTVLSTFPALNTLICDAQALWLSRASREYRNANFFAISNDSPEIISEWCVGNSTNVFIYSDSKLGEFKALSEDEVDFHGKMQLGRTFYFIEDGKVVFVYTEGDPNIKPNYDMIDKWLKG